MLLEMINKFIEMISNLDETIDRNRSMSYLEYEKENKEFKLLELDKEEKKYRKLLDDIKEDFKNDFISKEDLDKFKDRYMYELNKILLEKEDINNSSTSKDNINRIKRIKEVGKLDIIDRDIIQEFIETIYIRKDKEIDVVFKYKNLYEDALRYLNN